MAFILLKLAAVTVSFQADEALEAELVFLVDYSNRTSFVIVSAPPLREIPLHGGPAFPPAPAA